MLTTTQFRVGCVLLLSVLTQIAVAAPPVKFREVILAKDYGYTFGVQAADLDGDGDVDLINPDIQGKKVSTLYWFENDGKATFKRHIIFAGEPGWFERHTIVDINGDGRLDVAIINNLKGNAVWFENHAQPTKPWKRHVITLSAPRAYDITMADYDGDGLLDAAISTYTGHRILWCKNPGPGKFAKPWQHLLIDGKMLESRTIRHGDFNGDGRPDLLATAVGQRGNPKNHGSLVVWYENTGRKGDKRWRKRIIDSQLRAAVHGMPVDLDKDGDLDVVMAFGMRVDVHNQPQQHGVVWYENLGKGKAWKRRTVGKLPFAFEVIAADVDGDGDLDTVASAWSKGDRVVWFEQQQAGRQRTWVRHLVGKDFGAANQVVAVDLNGDKRLDIVGTSDDGSRRVKGALQMRMWINLGRKSP